MDIEKFEKLELHIARLQRSLKTRPADEKLKEKLKKAEQRLYKMMVQQTRALDLYYRVYRTDN